MESLNTITTDALRPVRRQGKRALWWWRYHAQPLHTDPDLSMDTLVRGLVEPHESYSYEEVRRIRETCLARDRRAPDERQAGSTRLQDCHFLYLLVRKLRPTTIFEVGTLVGSSASAMAQAQAELDTCGVVYTVDGSYGGFEPLDGHAIRCFPGRRSHEALATMRAEHRRIDFMFIDGTIGPRDVELLNEVKSPNLVVALHDYKPPIDKGIQNAWMLTRYLDGAARSVWVLPHRQGIGYCTDEGLLVNSSIAILLPPSRLDWFARPSRPH